LPVFVASAPPGLGYRSVVPMRIWLLGLAVIAVARVAVAEPVADACARGDAAACLDANDEVFDGGGREPAIIAALSLCEKGAPDGCLQAASFLRTHRVASRLGHTPASLEQRGLAQFDERCARDDAAACYGLGRQLLRGRYVARDERRGRALLEKACAGSHGKACGALAASPQARRRGRAHVDGLLRRACDLDDAPSCGLLGDRVDRRQAVTLYDKACAGDDATGCSRLGAALVRTAPERATAAWQSACDLGITERCLDAAALLETQDAEEARELYQRLCDADVGRGCAGLAAMTARGAGGPRRLDDARELYQQACAMNVAAACKAARRLATNPEPARCTTAATCAVRCDEQVGAACTALGRVRSGDDCDAASLHFVRGCELGDVGGCLATGDTSDDADDAAGWYHRACELASAKGCRLQSLVSYPDAWPAEQAKTRAEYRRACLTGADVDTCIDYASIADDGDAMPLLVAACNVGRDRACRALLRRTGTMRDIDALTGELRAGDPAPLRCGSGRRWQER
jgi:TPR repeat protein